MSDSGTVYRRVDSASRLLSPHCQLGVTRDRLLRSKTSKIEEAVPASTFGSQARYE